MRITRSMALIPTILALLALASTKGLGQQSPPAARRVALVVGNSAYLHSRPLPNARSDAETLAKVLSGIGFTVNLVPDHTYGELRVAIRRFSETARGSEYAVIYFAGHGLEIGGQNYLLPTDARLVRDADLEYEAITLDSLLSAVSEATRLRLVVLDACRNNPLAAGMALARGTTRDMKRGLARIEPSGNVLVAYSAKAGTVASDGDDGSSPYARALSKHLVTPGLDIRIVFGRVRDEVLTATHGAQEPFTYGSVGGQVVSLVVDEAPSGSSVGAPPREASRVLEARQAFEDASGSRARLKAVIERYGDTIYGNFAKRELALLADSDARAEEKHARDLENAERFDWATTAASNRLEDYRAYLRRRPQGLHAAQAHGKIALLQALSDRWNEFKSDVDFRKLESFTQDASGTEFETPAQVRLTEIRTKELTAWEQVESLKTLSGYEAFVAKWPLGLLIEKAISRTESLRAIQKEWLAISTSEREDQLEDFIHRHGWSEFGAAATAQLIAVRRTRAKPDDGSIKTLTAEEMVKALEGTNLRLLVSGEVLRFEAQQMPTFRVALGKSFLAGSMRETLAAEGAFESKVGASGGGAKIIGLGAVVKGKIGGVGSLFLLQMYGREKSRKDVDTKDRKYRTLQIVRDTFGYVCIVTNWQWILSGMQPVKSPERCAMQKNE